MLECILDRVGCQRFPRLAHLGQQGCIVFAAVEQGREFRVIVRFDVQDMGRTASFVDVGRQCVQRGSAVVARRHQIDAIAQHGCAGGLQRAPGPLAGGSVLGGQGQNESGQLHM
ncbi:hypothetical protein D3C80_1276930 [compost metagenome]